MVRLRSRPVLWFALLAACTASTQRSGAPDELAPALASLSTDDLIAHMRVLSSDEFEGRAPGTAGEKKTLDYLTETFRSLGLEPADPGGTFLQRVPLVGHKTTAHATLTTPAGTRELVPREDYVALTRRERTRLEDLELVFVGYGVVAPEEGWDDFKDVDVTGKALVMLVNDPQVARADDPSVLDDELFRGKAMTYYGRWTYKYEIARAKGAAAAIVVHETGPAGYPWEVVSGSWGREGFDLAGPQAADAHVPVEGWIQRAVAERLFAECGLDFEQAKRAALERSFRPISLAGARATFDCQAELRTIESANVAALRRGSHPTKKDELVVLSAHWDHLGVDPEREGDQIFNGALDNASGTAALLELAQAFTLVEPERSILFLAVTAEEKGLLGSRYYAEHPLWPLERTLANINMDGLNPFGRTRDVVNIGQGQSSLDELLVEQAALQDRRVDPDPEPEKGAYYRSDHFSFVRQGVPALYAESGIDFRGRPEGWGLAQRERYTTEDYHKPSDEMRDDWDLSGGLEDVALYLRIAWALSEGDEWPAWNADSEFRAVREEMLRARAPEPIVGLPCEGCEEVFQGLPAQIGSSTRLSAADEPGEPMRLEGTVRERSGRPVEGVIVYAYHTDAHGIYPPDERFAGLFAYRHGRLRGWARSDAEGRYRFDTIRPASYPDSTIPAHVHMHVIEPGRCTYWIDDVVFDGDPFLEGGVPPYHRGVGGNGLAHPERTADGAWLVRRDIVLGEGVPEYPER